jgi:hypothetical protein
MPGWFLVEVFEVSLSTCPLKDVAKWNDLAWILDSSDYKVDFTVLTINRTGEFTAFSMAAVMMSDDDDFSEYLHRNTEGYVTSGRLATLKHSA